MVPIFLHEDAYAVIYVHMFTPYDTTIRMFISTCILKMAINFVETSTQLNYFTRKILSLNSPLFSTLNELYPNQTKRLNNIIKMI